MKISTSSRIVIVLWVFIFQASHATLFKAVFLKFGNNIGKRVMNNVIQLLSRIPDVTITDITNSISIDEITRAKKSQSEALLLIIGNSTESVKAITDDELNLMEHESYIMKSTDIFGMPSIVCNGSPLDPHRHNNISFSKTIIHYGAVLSAYVCLEHLGFRFLHPLDFYIPSSIRYDPPNCSHYSQKSSIQDFCLMTDKESPYWPERSFHIHTQHPLELTEVLQGHDIPQFGPVGPHCNDLWSSRTQKKHSVMSTNSNHTYTYTSTKSHSSHQYHKDHNRQYCERWEDMVPDVDMLFQWAIANRLNKLEWLLLGNYKWGEGQLESRKKRMKVLTSIAHEYSLMVGADCPIGSYLS